MARAKKTTSKKTTRAPARKAASKKAPAKKAARKSAKKAAPKAAPVKKTAGFQVKKGMTPKASRSVKAAAEALWGVGVPPHQLLQELHEILLLRCLNEADGNYAGAAAMFGPSRQSVQQYANSSLRDARWKQYQQNRRKKRGA